MKTLKIGAFAILGLLAVACNDDDDNTTKLSSQEQAEMVASSIGRSGFSRSAEQAGDYADDNDAARVNAECGVEISNDWDLSGELGEGFSFIYNSDFTLLLTCSGDQPQSLDVDFQYTGSYTGPRFESSYSGEGDLTISRLNDDGDSFELNGSYDREGEFTVTDNGEVTSEGEFSIEIDANQVMISKNTHEITGGSADVEAHGKIEGRGSYSFKGDVTFSGTGASRKAIIKVAGDTYELNIQSNTLVLTSVSN